jgi:hypothetical protein
MKRVLICALAVAIFAMPSLAQKPDIQVWLQAVGGSDKITVGVSETAVIQLWADIGSGNNVVNIDALLQTYLNDFTPNVASFDVWGFNDIVITNSQMQRKTRGSAEPASPGAPSLLDGPTFYQYVGEDPTATAGTDGIAGPRSVLLDEIIIHGVADNSGTGPDFVIFEQGAAKPDAFYMDLVGFPPSWQAIQHASVTQGTGAGTSPLLVNVTPEPASLGLLLVGGLAALRRRR